jgi:hypothetical protein
MKLSELMAYLISDPEAHLQFCSRSNSNGLKVSKSNQLITKIIKPQISKRFY